MTNIRKNIKTSPEDQHRKCACETVWLPDWKGLDKVGFKSPGYQSCCVNAWEQFRES